MPGTRLNCEIKLDGKTIGTMTLEFENDVMAKYERFADFSKAHDINSTIEKDFNRKFAGQLATWIAEILMVGVENYAGLDDSGQQEDADNRHGDPASS